MRIPLVSALAILMLATAASAQPTTFTYQGRLKNGAAAAAGLHDFRFKLFDALSGGTQVGTTQCADDVTVTEGLFTTAIEFGQQFATPNPRFLEIEVRADTGLDCSNTTGFTLLTPRQPITAAPLANHAKAAFALDAPDGSPVNAVFVDNSGKVGIGTTTPTHSVHIANPAPTLALQDTGSQQVGYVSYRDSTNTETAWVGYGTEGDPDFSIVNARTGGDIVLNPFNGNVGVGTATPAAKLEVRGDIRLGSTGQFFAPGSDENLRIIRGVVLADGTIHAGTGFTVTPLGTGGYRINFQPSFGGAPAVTIATQVNATSAVYNATWNTLFSDRVNIFTYNINGVLQNGDFSFIAIGPR